MDNTELRRILLADPFSDDPALQHALAQDAALRQFASELQQQQRELEDALQVPVPPMRLPPLLAGPKGESGKGRAGPLTGRGGLTPNP